MPSTARSLLVALIFLALAVYLFDVLLLFFAAALLAVVFRAPSEWLSRRTGLDVRWALGIVLLLIATLLALAGWLIGSTIIEQIGGLTHRIPRALDELRARVSEMAVMGPLVENATQGAEAPDVLAQGAQALRATLGAIATFAIVVFVAILLAAQPEMYVRGALHLLPLSRRERAAEVFATLGHLLRRWMLAQLFMMMLVGLLTFVGFELIDAEFAGALALLAGALTFVPFLGSLVAGFIAVIVTLAQGPTMALTVAAVYVVVQIIENLCEPFVEQRAVYLAPALLLFAQLVLGVLAGALGIILATPLAAVTIVLVKMLYIQDRLGDREVSPES